MIDLEHQEPDRISRQRAAERLIDLAYALTAGGPLELNGADGRITVPVGNELHLKCELRSTGEGVKLALELRFSTPDRISTGSRAGSE